MFLFVECLRSDLALQYHFGILFFGISTGSALQRLPFLAFQASMESASPSPGHNHREPVFLTVCSLLSFLFSFCS